MKTATLSFLVLVILIGNSAIDTFSQQNGFLISSNSTFIGYPAFDGTNYLVGLVGDQTNDSILTLQFITQSGQLLGNRIPLGETGSAPVIAFDGTNYLVIWTSRYVSLFKDGDRGLTNIYGRFINPSGSFIGNKFTIATNAFTNMAISYKVLFNGSNYFYVYQEDNGMNGFGSVYGQMISKTGTLIGPAIQISNTNAREIDMAFDGTNYLVVWASANNQSIHGQFVSNSGVLTGSNFVIDGSTNKSDNPVFVAFNGTNYLVSFHDEAGNEWTLKARIVSQTGVVGTNAILIADTTDRPFLPILSSDGVNFLATWVNLKANEIRGQSYTSSGLPYKAPFVVFGAESNIIPIGGSPTFAGNKFLAFCAKYSALNYKSSGVFGKFLDLQPTSVTYNTEGLIRIYPNPAKDVIKLNMGNLGNNRVNIYNVAGELILSKDCNDGNQEIAVGSLSTGVYLVEIVSAESVYRQKLVIQK